MTINVAINGFGRIGRLVLRAILESGRKDINVVAINDLGTTEANAHLLQYDSVHGVLPMRVRATKSGIRVGKNSTIKVIAQRDPAALPWDKMNIDVVLECTGLFTDKTSASKHLQAGAKRVLVSAPAAGADLTVVYGVNHKQLKKAIKLFPMRHAQQIALHLWRKFWIKIAALCAAI